MGGIFCCRFSSPEFVYFIPDKFGAVYFFEISSLCFQSLVFASTLNKLFSCFVILLISGLRREFLPFLVCFLKLLRSLIFVIIQGEKIYAEL